MLEITVFCSGALVMVLEMIGARVLAPHVGTSAIVWTSMIGVVLACLAAGAWAGGRFADKKLSRSGMAMALCGAALGSAITAFFHFSIGQGITGAVGNLYAAAIMAAICIFALPAFFFGMITPYAIRLRIASIDTAGATVGRLYALSTAGSIVGTFLGGFILISFFSSTSILWGVAISMLILSLANFTARPWPRSALLCLFAFLAWHDNSYAEWLTQRDGPKFVESPYNTLRISEGKDYSRNGRPVRLMATDPGYSQSGMLVDDPNELYFDYTRFYALGPRHTPGAKSALMLGGGGYSVPKWLLSGKSGIAEPASLKLTVVELDPAMTQAARDYFGLKDDPRMKIIHEDARSFLNSQKDQYDLVFVDVFNSHYSIPFQMGTVEAAKAMRRAVAPGGALLMNLISAVEGENGRLFRAIYQGLAKEFGEVRVYCVGLPEHPEQIQNLMLMALPEKTEDPPPAAVVGMRPGLDEIAGMERHLYKKTIEADVPPLTDDYAPVERYALMLLNR